MKYFIDTRLFPADTVKMGRGIFCSQNLAEGELIEISPVIILSEKERPFIRNTPLQLYIFNWEEKDTQGLPCCLGLGYLSLYNHSYTANCEYRKDFDASSISISTVRPIAAGTELTINYNGRWDDPSPLWFETLEG